MEEVDGYLSGPFRVMIPCICGIWLSRNTARYGTPIQVGISFQYEHRKSRGESCPPLLVTVSEVEFQKRWMKSLGGRNFSEDFAVFAYVRITGRKSFLGREEALTG